MTPAQQLRDLVAHLPGRRAAQALAIGVPYQRLIYWLDRAAHDDRGDVYRRKGYPPPGDEVLARLRAAVRHAAELARAAADA